MYAKVVRVHLHPPTYFKPPQTRNLHSHPGLFLSLAWVPRAADCTHFHINEDNNGNHRAVPFHPLRYTTRIKGLELEQFPPNGHQKQEKIRFLELWKACQRTPIEHLVARHRRRLCSQLLSGGHGSKSIAAQWRESLDTTRLSAVGAYLASTSRDRILLRVLEGYLSAVSSQKRSLDINASSKVLIWCIEDIFKHYRSKSISFGTSRSRAERILDILIGMTQHRSGHGFDSIKIGTSRAKFLIHLLSPVSIFRLYNVLLLSKSEVPDRILLSILHALSEAGMFVQALQVFQKLALSPSRNDKSLSLRKWQFRRLFLKLYRAGIPIHESDVISFFSSFGKMDPLIYKLLIYAAAGVNDANSVHKLTKDHENQTGAALPLDVVSAVFLMHHRLGDSSRLEITYNDAQRQGLQPLSNSFFVTAVMLVETHKENASYWGLCKLYRRFFKPFALNLLELPLPRQRNTPGPQNALLEPTIGTLTIMLNSYLRTVAGNLEGSRYALTIYWRYISLIRNNGHIPQFQTASEHFVACIVSAVARYKPNLGLALGIVQDMIDFSDLPHPTSLTWDSLLQASTLHRDPDTSEKIWEAMLEHGIPPTTHTYSAMIMLYATVGDREKSDIIRYRITQEGWALTPHLRNALEVAERKLTYRMVRGVGGTET
ncbi:hypothetical protein TWF569_011478 [Orbilia oligospora]|uniref:Pentacotripeptide-repeat region of PRORP domain-containing protein n=1 Tax=Orbilia oligospora TaxID=2813651 RepID=A0A7C8JGZ2_ORBOL|nr:hypothetical protein TWF706_010695 [Orbilia oligospora]KAF3091086.1 hypothetical protein TWF102_008959 [Orbilia oligospora]KAF3097900.1 hypothetical protein TWF103_009282 [Orbilia oligospora]KAF3131170.1 hypothetical protein TWF569_011478 [Orbilia oligospora]KAF3131761.1 hypothetical protein TWF594_009782 [Orbilia oligospora]